MTDCGKPTGWWCPECGTTRGETWDESFRHVRIADDGTFLCRGTVATIPVVGPALETSEDT